MKRDERRDERNERVETRIRRVCVCVCVCAAIVNLTSCINILRVALLEYVLNEQVGYIPYLFSSGDTRQHAVTTGLPRTDRGEKAV